MDIVGSYALTDTLSEFLQPFGFAIEEDTECFLYDGIQDREGRKMEVFRARGSAIRGIRKLVYEITFREDHASSPVSSVEVLVVRDDSCDPVHFERHFSGNSMSYKPILKRILNEDVRTRLSDILSH